MNVPWGVIAGLAWKLLSILKSRPCLSIEAELVFEDAGGCSNASGTLWNLWKELYLKLCVTNKGGPTTIKEAYVSVRDGSNEVLRFLPWKVLKYINRKDPSGSPELKKALIGARLKTNDSWGPHFVLFTTQTTVSNQNHELPEGDFFLIIEVVGQRRKALRIQI